MDSTRSAVPWRDSCTSIEEALVYMLQKEIIVDAVFKRNGLPELYAHKLVLSLWSPIFADMITQLDKKEILSIPFNEDVEIVEAIIKFMYSSDSKNIFSKMQIEKLDQASEFSKRYGLENIYKKCMLSIQRKKISPKNVVDFFDFGIRKKHAAIINKCIKVFKFEGITPMNLKQGILFTTIVNILYLDSVAVRSEACLLNLAVSWLSYPENKCCKSRILSLIDLECITWIEYKQLLKKFPNFFSNSELSSIFLGLMRQDPKLFPEWYKPKIKSAVVKNCSSCISVYKQLTFLTDLHSVKGTRQKDSTNFCIAFEFVFDSSTKARLLTAELNFGPNEIREKNIKLFFGKGNVANWKECLINSIYGSYKYSVFFQEPVEIQSGEKLTLKFNFRQSEKDKIHVCLPNVIERQKLNKALSKDCVEVKLPSKVAFYVSKDKTPKFLIASFNFNFCKHDTYLIRKYVIPQKAESVIDRETQDDRSSTRYITMETGIQLGINSDNLCSKYEDFKMNSSFSDDIKMHSKDEDVKTNILSSDIKLNSKGEDFKMNILSSDSKLNSRDEDFKLPSKDKEFILPSKDEDFKMNILSSDFKLNSRGEDFKMPSKVKEFRLSSKDEDFKMDIVSRDDVKMDIISSDDIKKEVIDLSDD